MQKKKENKSYIMIMNTLWKRLTDFECKFAIKQFSAVIQLVLVFIWWIFSWNWDKGTKLFLIYDVLVFVCSHLH